jgi:cell wall integrity and stress response component
MAPYTSVETVTGQVRVITVTPSAPAPTQTDTGDKDKGGGGLGTGGAVGLTIGLVALAAIIGALIFFFLRRKRQRKAEEEKGFPGSPNLVPQRSMSENSRYMLGTDGRRVVEGWADSDETPVSAGSRRSRLMPVDPRLDPFAPVYQRGENKSRESVQTIQDNHDYSRRVAGGAPILRAINPDT